MVGRIFRIVLFVGFVGAALGGLAVAWFAYRGGHFVSPVRLAFYGAAPIAIAIVSAAALARGHRWRMFIFSYGLAVVAALVCAELYLQWHEINPVGQAAAHRGPAGVPVQTPLPHGCASNFLRERPDGELGSALTVDGAELLPLTGLADNPLVEPDGNLASRRTDKFGFNNPPGQWLASGVDILVVGDSFAFGADVPIGKGFADLLRLEWDTVVNLGCGGNGPLMELAALTEYGPRLRPRIVIWAYYEGNDLTKNIRVERSAPILTKYLTAGAHQDLAALTTAIQPTMRQFLEQRRAADARRALAPPARGTIKWRSAIKLEYLRTALGLTYGFKPHDLTWLANTLTSAREEVDAWGGQLVFTYLPGETRFVSWIAGADADGYRRTVLDSVRTLGIPIIDLVPAFSDRPQPRGLFRGHYTTEGHQLVADTVNAILIELHLSTNTMAQGVDCARGSEPRQGSTELAGGLAARPMQGIVDDRYPEYVARSYCRRN